jgi:hypothetical protein
MVWAVMDQPRDACNIEDEIYGNLYCEFTGTVSKDPLIITTNSLLSKILLKQSPWVH